MKLFWIQAKKIVFISFCPFFITDEKLGWIRVCDGFVKDASIEFCGGIIECIGLFNWKLACLINL